MPPERLARWADHLRIERQVSPHTLNAYLRDITQFTGFLKGHLGAAPGLRDLETLKPMDFRAFMAARRNARCRKPHPGPPALGHPHAVPLARPERHSA
jgi:site-specific recombinase XerC